ncbi:uncharacterized protein LOC144130305 [Amblyomma americanum]
MRRKLALRFLILTVTLAQVAGDLNLTEEVERYIVKLNNTKRSITSWGMTDSYTYWTNISLANNVQPITATVGGIKFDPPIMKLIPSSEYLQYEIVTHLFNLTKSIYSPFPLPANVSLQLLENGLLKEKNVTFDMTSKPSTRKWKKIFATRLRGQVKTIKKELKNQKESGSLRKWSSQSKFKVNVTFSGFFAYETSAQNETEYYTVPVGNLSDTPNGLLKRGDNLTFTFEGLHVLYIVFRDFSTFKHILV